MANPPESPPNYSLSNCFNALTDHKEKRKDPEVRNVLLVVATLIATVTFAAGVNPPGGVWQEGKKAGTAIYASDETAFHIFLLSNTLALSSSVFIIICQTWHFPFFIEVLLAAVSMLLTYGASIFAVTPKVYVSQEKQRLQKKFRYSLWIAVVPIVVRVVVQIYKYDKWKQSGGQRKNDHGRVQRDNDG